MNITISVANLDRNLYDLGMLPDIFSILNKNTLPSKTDKGYASIKIRIITLERLYLHMDPSAILLFHEFSKKATYKNHVPKVKKNSYN